MTHFLFPEEVKAYLDNVAGGKMQISSYNIKKDASLDKCFINLTFANAPAAFPVEVQDYLDKIATGNLKVSDYDITRDIQKGEGRMMLILSTPVIPLPMIQAYTARHEIEYPKSLMGDIDRDYDSVSYVGVNSPPPPSESKGTMEAKDPVARIKEAIQDLRENGSSESEAIIDWLLQQLKKRDGTSQIDLVEAVQAETEVEAVQPEVAVKAESVVRTEVAIDEGTAVEVEPVPIVKQATPNVEPIELVQVEVVSEQAVLPDTDTPEAVEIEKQDVEAANGDVAVAISSIESDFKFLTDEGNAEEDIILVEPDEEPTITIESFQGSIENVACEPQAYAIVEEIETPLPANHTAEPDVMVEEVVATAQPEVLVEDVVAKPEPEAVVEEVLATVEPEVVVQLVVATAEPEAVVEEVLATAESKVVTDDAVVTAEPEVMADDVVTTAEPEAVEEIEKPLPASHFTPIFQDDNNNTSDSIIVVDIPKEDGLVAESPNDEVAEVDEPVKIKDPKKSDRQKKGSKGKKTKKEAFTTMGIEVEKEDEALIEAEVVAEDDTVAAATPEAAVDASIVADTAATPEPVVEDIVAATKPEAVVDEVVATAAPEAFAEDAVVTSEPEAVAEEVVAAADSEAVAEEVVAVAEPEPVAEEVVAAAKPEAVAEEVVAAAEPEAVVLDTPVAPKAGIMKKKDKKEKKAEDGSKSLVRFKLFGGLFSRKKKNQKVIPDEEVGKEAKSMTLPARLNDVDKDSRIAAEAASTSKTAEDVDLAVTQETPVEVAADTTEVAATEEEAVDTPMVAATEEVAVDTPEVSAREEVTVDTPEVAATEEAPADTHEMAAVTDTMTSLTGEEEPTALANGDAIIAADGDVDPVVSPEVPFRLQKEKDAAAAEAAASIAVEVSDG